MAAMTKAERCADALAFHVLNPLGNWSGKTDEARESAAELRDLSAANFELLEALKLADAMLSGANMNANVVEKKVRATLIKHGGQP